MAQLYEEITRKPAYWDRRSSSTPQEWFGSLAQSNVIYVGNLPFDITEEEICEHFGRCGNIIRLVVGLNQKERSSCGFAFIQFANHHQTSFAHTLLNGSFLGDRIIRCDWDSGKGIMADRKFGRGQTGMQIRDDQLNQL